MNIWIKKARYPTLVIFLAKCRRQKIWAVWRKHLCVRTGINHGQQWKQACLQPAMSAEWTVPRMDNPHCSLYLTLAGRARTQLETCADPGPAVTATAPGAAELWLLSWGWNTLPALSPVHWAQEVTNTELASCFFCPFKHKDGQPVTTSKFFFHFLLQYTNSLVKTLAWNYAKVSIPLLL